MRNRFVFSLGLALILLFVFAFSFANASGGSKATTFHIKEFFGLAICDIEVRFSWDSDSWKIGEMHEIAFSFEARNVNEQIANLTLSLKKVIVRLDSDIFNGAIDIVSEDVSNRITTLVWRESYITFYNTVRSFSYDVQAPKPYSPSTEDSNTNLYYWIELAGSYYHGNIDMGNGVTLGAGGGQLSGMAYMSNKGSMIGGIEDPAWITLKAEPQPLFPLPYVAVAVTLVGVGVLVPSAFLFARHRKRKKTSKDAQPPPPSNQQQPST